MGDYLEEAKRIPWNFLGRETVVSRIGRSLIPVGIMPFEPFPYDSNDPKRILERINDQPTMEKYLMRIVGTAIQVDKGKLVTCLHVVESNSFIENNGYLLVRLIRDNYVCYTPYPIQKALRYLDPRNNKVNSEVDLAVLISAAYSVPELPYEASYIEWGDSAGVGVGDSIIVGGYPYGTRMFELTQTNMGFIQPTFYPGIISAIIPAIKKGETRILQLSVPLAGGMSGGAVFYPETGKVIGMVTSGINVSSIPQAISYALPSEIIAPYVKTITFQVK